MYTAFHPKEVWLDTDGNVIQAHGGGILYKDGVYYWYGENKGADNCTVEGKNLARVDVIGISCYSSTDLYNWKNEGVVLPASDDPDSDLYTGKVLERPKCIYNKRTGKYLLWAHVNTADYKFARAGVAIADSPTGPFTYLGSFRPNAGEMSRDMTVFVDDDDVAYLFHSSEDNATMYCSRMNADYTGFDGTYTRNFEGEYREAPCVMKRNGRYYMVTSYCTGWAPNVARVAVADSVMGPWTLLGNPCVSEGAELTYGGQSTHILKVEDMEDTYIFMADIWKAENLQDSRYMWLPIEWDEDQMQIPFVEEWRL